MLTFYQYLAFLIPPIFVLVKGYFLSIEFSLYPYLTSSGLLPYKDIIDQHFPSLFFGTFSLPFSFVDSSTKLLTLLIGLNFLTTYLLSISLKKLSVANYQLWTLIFSLLLIFFSANTLWIETFICFLLAIIFYLNITGSLVAGIMVGVIISQIVLMRPTLVVFLFVYFMILMKNKLTVFIGGLAGLALSILYLIRHNILGDFYNIAVIFNRDVYVNLQSPHPTLRQLLSIALLVILFITVLISKKSFMWAIAGLTTIILAFPRFGQEHLQVFGLVFVYILSQLNLKTKQVLVILFIATILGGQSLFSIFKVVYGNYFYSPDTLYIASQIKQLPDKKIYLYGASDLIYLLSEKLPPDNYYLPSLPWYINYQPFQSKLKQSLKNTMTVIVDPEFSVDGHKLIDTTPELLSYIKMNYYLDRKIKHLEVYKLKQ